MKKIIVSLMLIAISTQAYAGACDSEKAVWDSAKSRCEDWCQASGIVSTAGSILGIMKFGPWGGACGVIGGVPGLVAKRMCDIAKERERAWHQCENHQVELARIAEEERKAALILEQAKAAGKVCSSIFMRKRAEYEVIAQNEINEMVDRYIDSGVDTTDPTVMEQINQEAEAIQKKYF